VIKIDIDNKVIYNSILKSKSMGELKDSIRNGKGNLIGFIGEYCVQSILKDSIISNTYDYDLICNDKKYDIKSKQTSVVPSMDYECSVADYNTRQKCDYYVFTRVLWKKESIRPESVYIMGYYEKEKYFKDARFLKKGDIDGSNGFVVRADCWNMKYSELKSF
jgi:hypothetical protein